MSSTLAFPAPLVGREQEMGFLQARLIESMAGRGGLVMVSGEAGIGKTSLTGEFEKLAIRRGCRVAVGKCIPGALSPYLPFQDGLNTIIAPKEQTVGLGAWLRGPKARTHGEGDEPRLDPESESGKTLFSALESFRKLSEKRPFVIALEDLHWADSASIQLLHFLARNCRDTKVMILGTYRPEDVSQEREGKAHPLLESLRAMRRESIVQELQLDRLSHSETKSAVQGILRDNVDPGLLEKIATESGGNPLFAVEIVRMLVQTGSIVNKEGSWRPIKDLRIEIPSTVKEVILRRVERLPKEERRFLEYAAVAGEWFDPALLAETLSITKLDLLEKLDSIERSSELIKATDGPYHFAHEKIRRVTYDQVSPSRRREAHAALARTFEKRPPEDSLFSELSTHFFYAGETGKCIKYSLLAGTSSLRRFALREAIEHFQRVIEVSKDSPVFLDDRIQAVEGIGDCEKLLRKFDHASSFFNRFLELSRNPREKARALRKLADCSLRAVDLAKTAELLDEMEKVEHMDESEVGNVKWLRGMLSLYYGRMDEAERFMSAAEKIFEETGATSELAYTLVGQVDLFLSTGHTDRALEASRRAAEIYTRIQSPSGESASAYALGITFFHMGMVKDALESYAKCLQIASKLGSSDPRPFLFRGLLYYSIDDYEAGKLEALNGRDEASRSGSSYFLAATNSLLSLCEMGMNHLVEAEKALDEAFEIVERIAEMLTSRERTPLRFWLEVAQAQLFASRKEWNPCREKLVQALDTLRPTYYGILFEAMARTRFGEALAKQGQNEEAKGQIEESIQLYKKLGNNAQAERLGKFSGKIG